MSKIKLYSLATANGRKVGIALEEMGLPYEAHTINIGAGVQHEAWFLALNPNGKIPVIVDPEGPEGDHAVMESGAILLYLAEKSGKLLSQNPAERSETLQWLFFASAHIGATFGQLGHFALFAKDACDHPYPAERYTSETKRLLQLLEQHLADRAFLVGEAYSIADIAIFPWVASLEQFFGASNLLELDNYPSVNRWLERIQARPKTQQGMTVCAMQRPGGPA